MASIRRQQQFSSASTNVRCATLMGHVDHGKSSYADSLLAANSIISARQAGKLRYLDSREDEQERGITMESSAVSLSYKARQLQTDGTPGEIQDFMINLIDTPGHVDFSSEVSTASRLCDGTLIIVDVVEGVCTQTITVLRQAWDERLAPILVLNKMDRLVTDLKLSPNEAFHHLTQLIEQVNAVMGSFFAIERMEDDQRWHEDREKRLQKKKATQDEEIVKGLSDGVTEETMNEGEEDRYEELDDEDIYFDPGRGNVIFASAIDNWAFRIDRFSQLYSKKLGIQEKKFRKVLWGDFYFDPKSKRIIGHKQKEKDGKVLKPVFVQFVLENIWAVYESAANRDQDKLEKIVKTLDLKVHPRDLKSKDTSSLVQSIFSQWLPLASCTFSALVSNTPPPSKAQRVRIPKMLHPDLNYFSKAEPSSALEGDLFDAKIGSGVRRCAYVSKMFAVRRGDLPEGKRKEMSAEEMRQRGKEARERAQAVQAALKATGATSNGSHDEVAAPIANGTHVKPVSDELSEEEKAQEVVLGFSRLYSGTLKAGQTISALLPKYNPLLPPSHPANVNYIRTVTMEGLYMMMGRDLIAVTEVPAGNIFAVRGLEGIVIRNATLCGLEEGESDKADDYVNLAGINKLSSPIVRVALEPKSPSNMPKLVEGLRLLNQADPCVEIIMQSTGEHVIACAGELHLERCLKDLRERFAKCAIQASPPLVPFRETAVRGVEMAPSKAEGLPRGSVQSTAVGGMVQYRMRAVPLPSTIADFLLVNARTIRRLLQRDRQHDGTAAGEEEAQETTQQGEGNQAREVKMDVFWTKLSEVFDASGSQWKGLADQIWSLGPRKVGPNILIDARASPDHRHSLRRRTEAVQHKEGAGLDAEVDDLADRFQSVASTQDENGHARGQGLTEVEEAIDTGFQLATLQGPMCAEPMQGMAFFVESVEVTANDIGEGQQNLSQLKSSLIGSIREACRNGLLDWSPRLMLAMYSCDIQASTEVLGKVHAVLSRRRGRITSEEMKEGTSFFTVGALLPVIESFGFADGESSLLIGLCYSSLTMLSHHQRFERGHRVQLVLSSSSRALKCLTLILSGCHGQKKSLKTWASTAIVKMWQSGTWTRSERER
jgi:ribosome assembly protein 1